MRPRATATILTACLAAGLHAADAPVKVAIRNGDMSAGTATADGWTSTWRDTGKGEALFVRDTTVFRTAPASLCIASKDAEIGATITAFTVLPVGKTAEIAGWVKGEGQMKVTVFCQGTDDAFKVQPPGMIKLATFEVGTTADWRPFSGTVAMPAGATRLAIGLLAQGSGKAWLDDVRNAADPDPGAAK